MSVTHVDFSRRDRAGGKPPATDRYGKIKSVAASLHNPTDIASAIDAAEKTDTCFSELKRARKGGANLICSLLLGNADFIPQLKLHCATRREKHRAMQTALTAEKKAVTTALEGVLGRGQWKDLDIDKEVSADSFDAAQRRQEGNKCNDIAWQARSVILSEAFARSTLWKILRARTFLNRDASGPA